MLTSLLLLVHGSAVFSFLLFGAPHLPVDKCFGSGKNYTVAEDVDMRKMMGRWFVGMYHPHSLFHRLLDKGHGRCVIYEFGHLILANHTTAFNVTVTYKTRDNTVRKEFGSMRSSVPRQAMLMHYACTWGFRDGQKFWILKVGPEGKDSFGRAQYDYAVVGRCAGTDIVLVRNPQNFKEKYKTELVSWINSYLDESVYSDCYSDSITQTIGASDEGDEKSPVTAWPFVDHKLERNQSCDSDNITLAQGFEPGKMMGRCFEGLTSLPNENRTCIVYEYSHLKMIGSNDTITPYCLIRFEVQKTFREAGYSMRKEEYSLKTNDRENPKFGSQIWIYKIGPEGTDSFGRVQYDYVIVSNCERSPVLVLNRNPATFEEMHKKSVMTWLEKNNFEEELVQPDYTSCHYADSINQ